MSFEKTTLWQTAFPSKKDRNEEARDLFRVAYRSMRDRAGTLVSLISRDMPDYTVHDITHLDALWELASQIAGPSYPINPAEAFVLGGAILLHDAGMTVAAYPRGLEEIKETKEWQDTVALFAQKDNRAPTDEKLQKDVTCPVLSDQF
jgi:hypothetical protein